ncbi:copper chaperone for superoxide dismutase [Episyrphus balteatus]|uniref:copper chaperone for superoxide dismutase n=1 Tax=Episyrphus balteatus TaxID=286459 RepID=UPI0024858BC7|nr:copper chaperone for superoxide dismutase [Episyrphus balteatus]
MSEIKIEFAVQMSGEKCSEKVKKSLEGVGEISINLKEGRVVVTTKHPWSDIQDRIEKTGRTAVLCGFGGKSAVAMINNSDSKSLTKVQGVVRFSAINNEESGCVVDGVIDGLSPGLHGIHLHECGDISAGYESLGGHYNPRGSPHGSPENSADKRHVGDLGNIRADEEGRATFRFIDPLVEVWDIIGRSVVVTENPDDLGRGGNERSLIDGNSGDRIACGIIARSAGILQNYKKICACDGVTLWDERNKPLAGGNRNTNGKL